jgi:hypothetical protein
MRLSQRRPLAFEVTVAGPHGVAVDAFNCDALAAPTLDDVVDPEHNRPNWHKGGD